MTGVKNTLLSLVRLPGRLVSWVLVGLISLYQRFISPMSGPSCRYYPSCSAYGKRAIEVHGPIKGLLLTSARLLRCNPWSGGGINPIPRKGEWRSPVDTLGNQRHACDREGESPSSGHAGSGHAGSGNAANVPTNPAFDRAA